MSASPEHGGKCRACEAIGACLRTQVRIFKSCILCLDSSLRSRMTGRYLIPLCKNRFFRFCSRLPLSTANAATFPDKRGQLTINILSVFTHFYSIAPLPEYGGERGQFTACILYSFMTRQTVRTGFYFFSLFSSSRKPQGFLFPWGLLILLYAFTISAVSAFLLTLTLSMTGFPFLSLEMTSIRKCSNSSSNS